MDQTDIRTTPQARELYAWWHGVRVTEATVTVADETYAVRDLRELRERPGRQQPLRRVVLGVALAQAAVVALALAGLVRAGGATVVVYAIGVGQTLTTTVLIGLARLRWPRPQELWAKYRGEPTMLYRDADRYEFGKVGRAVQRAMQAQRLLN